MINNVSSFQQYFKDFADSNTALNGSFYYGNADRIIGAHRSQLVYPVLWLETPTVQPVMRGGTQSSFGMVFQSAFVILHNAQGDITEDEQKTIEDNTLAIAWDLIRTIFASAEADEFDFDMTTTRIEPINTFMVDNDHGWRVEFSIETDFNEGL
jgi:hypothetical protein